MSNFHKMHGSTKIGILQTMDYKQKTFIYSNVNLSTILSFMFNISPRPIVQNQGIHSKWVQHLHI